MKRSKKTFLELLEEQNRRVADLEAEKSPGEKKVGMDPIREARDAERREQYGKLRALPNHGKRHGQKRPNLTDQ